MNKRAKGAAETVEQHKARLSRQRERIIDDVEPTRKRYLLKLIMSMYKTLL